MPLDTPPDVVNIPSPSAAGEIPGMPPIGGLPATVSGMSPQMLNLLMGIISAGGGLGAAALQAGNTNRAADYLEKIGGTASGQNASNLANATGTYGQQSPYLNNLLSGQDPYMSLLKNGYMGNVQTLNNLFPGLVNPGQNQAEFAGQPTNQIYADPNMTAELRGITNLTGNTGGMLNMAAQLLNSGGITNTQSPLNAYAQALMNGQNPNQMALSGAGTSLLGSQGMTPALQQALQQASGIVGGQGQTALTNTLAQRGLDLSAASPLLSGATAASIASDQAGRQFANQAENARAQQALRGGGAGATVANGANNNALADTSDAALNAIANSANQARLGQQGLGLTQQQQGLNTALGAGQLQQGLELGALGNITGLTGAQTGLLGQGGNLTNAAAQLGNQGANFYNSLLGLQQGNMAQGFQAGQAGVSQQQGLLQQAIQDLMTGQNNSAATGNTLANLYQGNQGALLAGIGQGNQTGLGASSQLGGQAGNWLSAAMNALGTYGQTGNSFSQLMQQPNAWSVVLNNLAGSGSPGSGAGNAAANTAIRTGIQQIPGIIKGATGNGTSNGFDFGSFLSGGGFPGSGPFDPGILGNTGAYGTPGFFGYTGDASTGQVGSNSPWGTSGYGNNGGFTGSGFDFSHYTG